MVKAEWNSAARQRSLGCGGMIVKFRERKRGMIEMEGGMIGRESTLAS